MIDDSRPLGELAVDTETDGLSHYEVFSPKVDGSGVREIPIFVEDRNYMIPTKVTTDTGETEVTTFSKTKRYLIVQ